MYRARIKNFLHTSAMVKKFLTKEPSKARWPSGLRRYVQGHTDLHGYGKTYMFMEKTDLHVYEKHDLHVY